MKSEDASLLKLVFSSYNRYVGLPTVYSAHRTCVHVNDLLHSLRAEGYVVKRVKSYALTALMIVRVFLIKGCYRTKIIKNKYTDPAMSRLCVCFVYTVQFEAFFSLDEHKNPSFFFDSYTRITQRGTPIIPDDELYVREYARIVGLFNGVKINTSVRGKNI